MLSIALFGVGLWAVLSVTMPLWVSILAWICVVCCGIQVLAFIIVVIAEIFGVGSPRPYAADYGSYGVVIG